MKIRDEKPLLQVDKIGIRFGGLVALEDINLKVRPGDVYGFLGPNGAGKTTLFNILAGKLRPTTGCVIFRDQDVTYWKPDKRSRYGIARTFQITQPFEKLTVEENVMVGNITRFKSLGEMREEAQQYIKMVGLEHKTYSLGKELSTGQRKRLELARAMATKPELLLLDEVTGGVDHASIGGLIDLVDNLRETGVTILVIEHNVRIIMRLANKVMFLNRGRIIAQGNPERVASHPDVVSLYLGEQEGQTENA